MPRLRSSGDAARRARGEAGVSTVEVVVATPVVIGFLLLIVYLGLYVNNIGKVQSAADDAARMESVQGTEDTSAAQQIHVQNAADADLSGTCNRDVDADPTVTISPVKQVAVPPLRGYPPAQRNNITVIQVTVTCDISVFGASYTLTASSTVPTDIFHGGP